MMRLSCRHKKSTRLFSIRKRQWHPTPALLPGKSHGRRSLVGCSPWGREESDTTERLPFHFSLSCIGEGNGNPLQCSCLENPRDRGAWWAAVYGVAQSRTWLKRLSSSSSILYSYRSTLHNTVFSEKSKCENYVILAFWEEKCRVVLAYTYIAYFWKDKQETDFLNGCFQLPKIELSCDVYIIFTCFVH